MTPTPEMTRAGIALNRFGLGARPDEALPADPRGWLLAQFAKYEARPAEITALPASSAMVVWYFKYLKEVREAKAEGEQGVRQKLGQQVQLQYRAAVNARVNQALSSPTPFAERMVHFWANHFAVSVDKNPVGIVAGAFENEAIRPHVFGRFEDMLMAAERHPAMLIYLDQARSIGPNSFAARRAALRRAGAARGLNENLAREIMELHTLGVRSDYSQEDVTEFARAMTGWTVGGLPGVAQDTTAGEFAYLRALHEPGPRTVRGQRYAQGGEDQAAAILHDLATAPTTARHIATKLARHFAGDAPPEAMVNRLADTFQRTGGDLPSLYRTLIDSPEAWVAEPLKFKTPWEWTLSSLRGLGVRTLRERQVAPMLTQLGQAAWRPGSPAGFDDIAASWAAPESLMRRVEIAQRLAEQASGTIDARKLSAQLLPGGVSDMTATTIARAENQANALALLLASPEFLRR